MVTSGFPVREGIMSEAMSPLGFEDVQVGQEWVSGERMVKWMRSM
jgi:hypothetical protein